MADSKLDIVVSLDDQASEPMKKIEGNFERGFGIAKSAALASAAAVAAVSAAAGALAIKGIKDFSSVGDAVDKMSKRTGISAEAVSAFRVAAEASGTSVEALEVGIRKMQKGLLDGDGASMKLADSMKTLGISLDKGFLEKKPEEQFEQLGNAIGGLETPAQRAQAAMLAFGISGTSLLPMFEDGAFSIDEWSAKTKALGLSFDNLSATKAAELNDALGFMSGAFKGLSLAIGGELAPHLTDFINNVVIPAVPQILSLVHDGFDAMKTAVEFLTTAAQNLYTALDQAGIIDTLTAVFGDLWNVIETQLWPAIVGVWEAIQPLMPLLELMAQVVGAILYVLTAFPLFLFFLKS